MKLCVPYIPDKKYTIFLKKETSNIQSVYFALQSGPVLDSRLRFESLAVRDLAEELKHLKNVKKYCLLNSRFLNPDFYHDCHFLNQTLEDLTFLYSHANLDGIVFNDSYLLRAMSKTGHGIIKNLEAVPGINSMIDSAEKASGILDFIAGTGFRLPSKIIFDRSLNRNLKQLEHAVRVIKSEYKHIGVELLANEGCLYHCPFKLSHDALISLSNTGLVKENTFNINSDFGCRACLFDQPEKLLKSPFIRPEDTGCYEGLADSIKLSGRTLGAGFLSNCITAYIKKSYEGNLADLLDASSWMADLYWIDNKKLDPGFLKIVTSCEKKCDGCSMCMDLFKKAADKRKLTLKNFIDFTAY